MNWNDFTPAEQKELTRLKKYFLTCSTATPSSQTQASNDLAKIAKKYSVDTQIVWDAIPENK